MIITGVNTFSLLDYPGKISCVIYTAGCNLRCGYCHNKEFVLPEYIQANQKNVIPQDVFFRFLEKRKGLIDAVSVCGGEPTYQKDLPEFCARVKEMGFLVKVDTNGSNPKALEKLIGEGLVDYIAMDVKYDFKNYSEISGKKEPMDSYFQSIKLILETAPDYEFRTTCVAPYHTEEVMKRIGETIKGAKKYFLQNFRRTHTLNPFFIGEPFLIADLERYKELMQQYADFVDVRA